ncbi:hypothetical protein E1H99_06405 [Enterococcus hirae]|nr:hypothetical protein E1H99_06405 [Enterococcus hirae]
MAKVYNIEKLRVIKILQIILVLLSVYAVIYIDGYVAGGGLLIGGVLELFVPNQYGWGLRNRKSVFLTDTSSLVENLLIFGLILIGTILISIL